MKSFRILIPVSILGFTVLFAGACDHSGKHHHHEAEASEHHHAALHEPLHLNNGEQWEADNHTRIMVAQMKQTVDAYEQSGQGNYRILSDSLTHQLNRLVAGCTMEGPAHDELHKWLVPLTENIKQLSSVKGPSAIEPVHKIDASLQDFDRYFK